MRATGSQSAMVALRFSGNAVAHVTGGLAIYDQPLGVNWANAPDHS